MSPPPDVATRYLLGELTEAERDALEDQYFSDEEAFESLKAAEDELIDAYCRGTLDDELRRPFEARYLQSESGRRRLAFARALKTAAVQTGARRRPAVVHTPRPWAAWAAGLGALLLGGAMLLHLRDVRHEREAAQRSVADQEERLREQQQRLSQLARELRRLREAGPARLGRVATLVLATGLERGGGRLPSLALDPSMENVQLLLPLPRETSDRYRVAVQNVDGRELWSQAGLSSVYTEHGRALVATLPAERLKPEHYVVVVTPGDAGPGTPGMDYVFEVRR